MNDGRKNNRGTKGNRGKRVDPPTPYAPSESAPQLAPDYESITAYIAWIAREQAAGNIDRADAKELRDHAKAMVTALRARHSEHELDEMRGLVKRAEQAVNRGDAIEVAERYGGKH